MSTRVESAWGERERERETLSRGESGSGVGEGTAALPKGLGGGGRGRAGTGERPVLCQGQLVCVKLWLPFSVKENFPISLLSVIVLSKTRTKNGAHFY